MTTTTTFTKINDIFQCKLVLEDGTEIIIPMREDGYIHATKLCQAAGKRLNNWMRIPETREIIRKFVMTQNESSQISAVEVYKGKSAKYTQGTWVHPRIGIHLAQWCSPNFSLQVSKWIHELIITQEVRIGHEKSDDEIRYHYEKIVSEMTGKLQQAEQIIVSQQSENKYVIAKYDKLYQNHQSFLRRKELYKLREGACVYLINMRGINDPVEVRKIKIGYTGNITARVAGYRTSNPYCQVLFVLYTIEHITLEKNMKIRYEQNLIPNNREFISDIPLEELISDIKTFATLFNSPYMIETEEELTKFNDHIIPVEEVEEKLEPDDPTVKRCGGMTHFTEESRMVPLTNFFKNKSNLDGYARLCKECYLVGVYGDDRKRRKVVIPPKFDTTTHKWCNLCESVKSHSDFYNCTSTKDGLNANCKSCKSKQKQDRNRRKEIQSIPPTTD